MYIIFIALPFLLLKELQIFLTLICLWFFPSYYFQKGKKKTGKLPHTNIFFLNLTFNQLGFFFFLLANDGHGNEQNVRLCLNIKNEIRKIIRLVMKRRYKPLSETTVLQVFPILPRSYPPTPEPLLGADTGSVCYQKAMLHLLYIALKAKQATGYVSISVYSYCYNSYKC